MFKKKKKTTPLKRPGRRGGHCVLTRIKDFVSRLVSEAARVRGGENAVFPNYTCSAFAHYLWIRQR